MQFVLIGLTAAVAASASPAPDSGVFKLTVMQGTASGTYSQDPQRIADMIASSGMHDEVNSAVDLSKVQPQDFKAAASVLEPLNLPLYNGKDFAYYIDFQLGTPGQNQRVLADTGSNELWVGSALCNARRLCADKLDAFNEAKSTSFVDLSKSVLSNVTYGKGSVVGYQSTETVQVGPVVVQKTPLLLVQQEDSNILKQNNRSFNGIMGLAHVGGLDTTTIVAPNNPAANIKTVVHNMINLGLLAQPMFSMWLGSGGSEEDTPNGGEITLGGVDASRFTGAVNYFSVSKAVVNGYYWSIQVSQLALGGKPKAMADKTFAIIDSGTTFINVDKNTFMNMVLPAVQAGTSQATGAEYFAEYELTLVPCENVQYLPSFAVSFSEKSNMFFTINTSQLVLRKKVADKLGRVVEACILGITPGAVSAGNAGTVWILGEMFLRRFYTVHSFSEGGRVGFALLSTDATGTITAIGSEKASSAKLVSVVSVLCLVAAALVSL